MIAAFCPLYNKFTVRALTVVEVILKKIDLIFITKAFVLLKITLGTKLFKAFIANSRLVLYYFYNSFAALFRTESQT